MRHIRLSPCLDLGRLRSAEIEGISLVVEIRKLAAMLAAIAFAAVGPIMFGRLDPSKVVLPSAFSYGFVALVLAAMLRVEPMVTKGSVFLFTRESSAATCDVFFEECASRCLSRCLLVLRTCVY